MHYLDIRSATERMRIYTGRLVHQCALSRYKVFMWRYKDMHGVAHCTSFFMNYKIEGSKTIMGQRGGVGGLKGL